MGHNLEARRCLAEAKREGRPAEFIWTAQMGIDSTAPRSRPMITGLTTEIYRFRPHSKVEVFTHVAKYGHRDRGGWRVDTCTETKTRGALSPRRYVALTQAVELAKKRHSSAARPSRRKGGTGRAPQRFAPPGKALRRAYESYRRASERRSRALRLVARCSMPAPLDEVSDAPPEVRHRDPFPFCGREALGLERWRGHNLAARRCLAEAQREGRPAELVSTAPTVEGDMIMPTSPQRSIASIQTARSTSSPRTAMRIGGAGESRPARKPKGGARCLRFATAG